MAGPGHAKSAATGRVDFKHIARQHPGLANMPQRLYLTLRTQHQVLPHLPRLTTGGASPGAPKPVMAGSACTVACCAGAARAVTAALSGEFGASTPK